MLYVLLLFEVVLFLAIYTFGNSGLIAPATFSIFVITVATAFACIGNTMWNLPFSSQAAVYIIFGLIVMLFAQIAARYLNGNRLYRRQYMTEHEEHPNTRIDIDMWKVRLVAILAVILTMLYILDIVRAGRALGASGLQVIGTVKSSDKVGTNKIIRQGIKFIMAASFVDGYILVHNRATEWKKKDWWYAVSIVCACVCSVFTGVRTEILRVVFSLFVYFYVQLKVKRDWKKGALQKILKRGMPLVVILTIIFTNMKNFIKTVDLPITTAFSSFQYIAYYIGSPILVYGVKENTGFATYKGTHFGELIFNSIWQFGKSHGWVEGTLLQGSANVYISRQSRVTGNVDSIFGISMIDFGFVGMLIFIFILYFLLSYYYYKRVYRKTNESLCHLDIIKYAFIFYIPAMAYYTSVADEFITVYYIITFILMYLIYKFYLKYKIKF